MNVAILRALQAPRFIHIVNLIFFSQKAIEKGSFSLGDQVLLLNQDDNIDAFVFVSASGQRKSCGKKSLGVVMLNPLMIVAFYFINIGIADARSGDALAYTLVVTTFDIGKE